MQKEMAAETAEHTDEYDEELHDTLIAISVVAKRLAKKIDESQKSNKEDDHVQELRTGGKDRQSQKECVGNDSNGSLG